MTRPRHPKPEIEKAVQYAEGLGWRVELSNGHARQIRKVVDRCPESNDPNKIDSGEPEEGNE